MPEGNRIFDGEDLPLPSLDEVYMRCQQLGEVPPTSVSDTHKTASLMLQGVCEEFDKGDHAWLIKLLLDKVIELGATEAGLVEMKAKQDHEGAWGAHFALRHWAVPLLAVSLGAFLKEEGGPNSVQCEFSRLEELGELEFILTLCRKEGEMPNARAKRLEDELQQARAEIETLRQQLEDHA